MNIYKTKSGTYINMDTVKNIVTLERDQECPEAHLYFLDNEKMSIYGDECAAFLDYLDGRLEGVFAGYA